MLILHERVGLEGRRPSPFSWRIRYALAHKGVAVEYRPTRFSDVEAIQRLSGQRMVPVLVDGDRVVADSWRIAVHLEERFPDRPTLFGGPAGMGAARLVNQWSDGVLNLAVRSLIYGDFVWCLDPGDRRYFRQSREEMLGMSLEAASADRQGGLAALERALAPVERTLAEQPYLAGDAPAYVDYVVFSVFQWARLGSPGEIVAPDSAVAGWRGRMVDLFDRLGDRFPGYPERRDGPDGR